MQPLSKVLHLRNLPWDCTPELVELGTPFGKVVNTKCGVNTNRIWSLQSLAKQAF
jgi:polypyrimidine tract-binding protein 2